MANYSQMAPAHIHGSHDMNVHSTQVIDNSLSLTRSTDPSQIPLVCFACTDEPRFSDLSHLLTHVGSKSHLSQVFELRIAGMTDEESAQRSRKFELWNSTYHIDRLVWQRREARGEKGDRSRRRSQPARETPIGRVTSRGNRGGRGSRGGRSGTSTRSRARRTNQVEQSKFEPEETMNFGIGYNDGSPIHSWANSFSTLMPHSAHLQGMVPQSDFEQPGDEPGSPKYSSSETGSSFPSNMTESTEINEDTAVPALKGTRFPGMGLFDAAEEAQRRKRNQKKDPAVLQKLEVNSAMITTQEEVYNFDFELLRTRDVYDDASTDGSDDEEEEQEKDKKRKRRASQGPNSSNTRKNSTTRVIRTAAQDEPASSQISREAFETRSRALNDQGRDNRPTIIQGSMSQAQLPLHNHGFGGNTGLFHDSMGTDNEPDAALSPRGRRRRQHDRLPALALRPGNPNLSFASPSPGIKRSPSQFGGKENDNMSLKPTTSSSNPYLNSTETLHSENYNPLYVQPRDDLGLRLYTSYNEGMKPTAAGFQPINSHDVFNSLQLPHQNANFPSNHANDNDF